jgi:branched-chain amino acid transport system permease protein
MAVVLSAIQIALSAADRTYYLNELTMSAYYAVVALGLCLVMGYAGQISLGHAAFFAIGGYVTAAATTADLAAARGGGWVAALSKVGVLVWRIDAYGADRLGVAPWVAFAAALFLAALAAVLIGWPSLRLKGQYLAMATLGFGLIVYRVVLGTESLGSTDGIHGVPGWPIGGGVEIGVSKTHRVANYYIAWCFALGVLVFLLNVVRSRVGRALRSIHGGELAANAMGVNTAAYKLQAFVFSAVLAAAAGSLMTHYTGGIGPGESGAMKSVRYVALVAAGGMANLWGVLVVSTVFNFLSLRGCFGTMDQAVFGAILIAIVSLAPDGPLQPAAAWLRHLFGGRRTPVTGGSP